MKGNTNNYDYLDELIFKKTPKRCIFQAFRDFPIERETVLSASGACLARTEKLARASRRREQIPKESLRARSAL